MSRKETGLHFKRILSHTSSNSGGNPVSQRQTDCPNTKKFGKLKTSVPEVEHRRPGNSYKLYPDYEPLLNHELSTSPSEKHKNDKFSQRATSHNYTSGNFSPLDFRQDSPRGIMSVTDIKLTMGDDDHQNLLPTGSPMDDISSTSTSPKPGNHYSPLVRCSKLSCDENSCLWHRCVLKLPQHVRWEDRIITIELERKDNESFGFHHKSKQHIGKDEIYTLVSHVDEDSNAAKSGLALGDLILSANNVPMQTKQKFSEVNFRTQNKLRLLVQHPVDISSKAASHVEQLMASMIKINEHSTPPSTRLPQPPTPSTSPTGTDLSPTTENIPLFPISKPEPKNKMRFHQLPQVRIFICGNAAKEFTQCLIGDFVNNFHDDRARCFEISMKKLANGTVSIGNSESFSYLFEDSSESCVNVELISVANDRFFHHCCPWMFTSNSIFLLTFDTKRLSRSSEAEMSHLCSLAHTIQTKMPGAYSNIRLYGITSVGDNISSEEVQTLFYTSLGKSLPDPKVVPLSKGVMCEEMKQIRLDIFSIFGKTCEKQQVAYQTAIALDMLVSYRGLTTTLSDLAKTLENCNSDSKHLGHEISYRVVEDLRNTGNLLVIGSINAACNSENEKRFVLPCVLFDQLSCLAQCTEKERVPMRQQDIWVTLCTCGIVTRSEFLDILNVCTLEPEKVLTCMEDLCMVFPVKSLGEDSGFGDIGSVLFPFYMQDIQFSAFHADSYEIYTTIEFSADVPISSFFSFLSELSQSDNCHSFRMRAQLIGQMALQGVDICLYFQKTNRQIHIFKNRCDRPPQNEGKISILQQIQQTVSQQIPSNVKVNVKLHHQEKLNRSTDVIAAVPNGNCSHFVRTADTKREENTACRNADTRRDEAASCQPGISDGASALPNMPIPSELMVDVDTNSGAAVVFEDSTVSELSEEERATQRVLDMYILDLMYIRQQLHAIYRYLSVSGTLQQLASECNLTVAEWTTYETIIKNQSSKLPAEAFIEKYFLEKHLTLRDFIQILLRLKEKNHTHLEDLVKDLCTAALCGNSQFGGNFSQAR